MPTLMEDVLRFLVESIKATEETLAEIQYRRRTQEYQRSLGQFVSRDLERVANSQFEANSAYLKEAEALLHQLTQADSKSRLRRHRDGGAVQSDAVGRESKDYGSGRTQS